jgi:nicotinamide-nucleotide amidase
VKFPRPWSSWSSGIATGAACAAASRRRIASGSHLLYGTGNETLIDRVAPAVAAKQTVATAESCTGGMVGEMLTRMPGSSGAFLGGAIVYTNAEKVRQLGVSADTIIAHGAVSMETAVEMARGALERFGSNHAVAITGIAGPVGGTPEKPVGTVWLALASQLPGIADVTIATRKLSWPSTRDQVRTLSAWWALALIEAAIPAQDPTEAARARWILDGVKP